MGVIDEALPADGGAWLFKVDPHDDLEVILIAGNEALQSLGIFDGGRGIMDRAGADDDKKAVVLTGEDIFGNGAGIGHDLGCFFGQREVIRKDRWRDERINAFDAEVVCIGLGHAAVLKVF